jgi:hypothetical protein
MKDCKLNLIHSTSKSFKTQKCNVTHTHTHIIPLIYEGYVCHIKFLGDKFLWELFDGEYNEPQDHQIMGWLNSWGFLETQHSYLTISIGVGFPKLIPLQKKRGYK